MNPINPEDYEKILKLLEMTKDKEQDEWGYEKGDHLYPKTDKNEMNARKRNKELPPWFYSEEYAINPATCPPHLDPKTGLTWEQSALLKRDLEAKDVHPFYPLTFFFLIFFSISFGIELYKMFTDDDDDFF